MNDELTTDPYVVPVKPTPKSTVKSTAKPVKPNGTTTKPAKIKHGDGDDDGIVSTDMVLIVGLIVLLVVGFILWRTMRR